MSANQSKGKSSSAKRSSKRTRRSVGGSKRGSAQMAFGFYEKTQRAFGGSLLNGVRKSARPISTKLPMHLIIKAEGKSVFNPSSLRLRERILDTARECQISIYDFAVNWTHIHFGIRVKRREDYIRFIRILTSQLAQAIRKLFPLIGEIFQFRPFTRIVTHGPDFQNLMDYLLLNQQEAAGLVKREQKKPKRANTA